MLQLSRRRLLEWAREYDQRADPRDRADERAIKGYLRGQPAIKHLDKTHFLQLARWAAPRGLAAYERNGAPLIWETTRLASQASNERLKVHILTALDGVSVTVAAAVLHFFSPRSFPVFDARHRATLRKAGLWRRPVRDGSVEAWQEYVSTMRGLARRYRLSLRDLDKALYAYDRWGGRRRR
jgi:hypothetical protein